MCLELISSAEASPARTSRSPARAQDSLANAQDYGASSPELLAKYDPATSSWRTCQLCLDGEWDVFSATWPRSGMTRNGTAFQLPSLVPLTDAIDSGLWPTPTVQAARTCGMDEESSTRELERSVVRNGFPSCLATAVQGKSSLWPTPTANRRDGLQSHGRNAMGGALNPTWVEWLMGFPLGWTALEPSATPSSPKSPSSSDTQS